MAMAGILQDAAARSTSGRRRRRLPVAFELGAVMLLGNLALPLASVDVLQCAVEQGDMRHKARAVQAEASWRCHTLHGAASRAACLAELGPPR